MTHSASHAIHHATPALQVFDNRLLALRNIAYYRDQPGAAHVHITRQGYNASGQLAYSIDPRLHAAQADGANVAANLQHRHSLSGRCLQSRSVDAGTEVILLDASGREAMTWLANGVAQTRNYEHAPLPGRLLAVHERDAAQVWRTAERWQWADVGEWTKARNLAGHCHSRFDSGGKNVVEARSLHGAIARESLQLLASHAESDWNGDDSQPWTEFLEPEPMISTVAFDACGAIVASEDAKGHRQRYGRDRCGQFRASWVTLAQRTEIPAVLDVSYGAGGQKEVERHANGIVVTHSYAPDSQRLVGLHTLRLRDRRTMQYLRYQYDPTGLVTQVRNDAEQTRFWRNQKIEPQQDYRYDSLAQLIETCGRQMAALGQVGSELPGALAIDTSAYARYRRRYVYDQAGNLQAIRHSVPATGSGFITELTTSTRSNRTLPSSLCDDPSQIDDHFDAAGQQRALDHSQTTTWNSRMQLRSVACTGGGIEHYLYGLQHQRLRKTHALGTTRYLPGLEWHENDGQALHCISVGEHIRLLHWPAGSPNGVANDQLRYSYTDLLGSHGLELDGEGQVISREEFFPFGATAIWACRSQVEARYKTVRYSGKERDHTGLYYYGYRYYQPWIGRWLSADPAGTVDGLNLYAMVRNSPASAVDDDGRMLRIMVRGGVGAAGLGYEAWKHNEKAAQPAPQASAPAPSGSMGDRRADQAIEKIQRMKDEFSPARQIKDSAIGRAETAEHLAHGQLPGAQAVLEGASTISTVAEFSHSGSVSQLEKTSLAGAVATDAAQGVVQGVKGTVQTAKKVVQSTAELATLSNTKTEQLQNSVNDLEELAQDKLITGLSFGGTVKAGLDGAAAIVPHPVAKAGLKILSAAWTVTGVVHGAEELGEIAKTHRDLLASKTGENLMGQMKTINASNRGGITDQVRQSYGLSGHP
jgi:insecticidal toxin complex protein TccC